MRTAPHMWLPWPWDFSVSFPRPTVQASDGPVPMTIAGSVRALFHHDGVTVMPGSQPKQAPGVTGIGMSNLESADEQRGPISPAAVATVRQSRSVVGTRFVPRSHGRCGAVTCARTGQLAL